ncbi:sporulation protein [Thermoflavimicrobium dichotomicum]|uniref:Sporulation-control protein spo0M n=1 Tax=Thermoflavimicrobium dichotomicum TaxID=46223 RepID=A0A1I3P8B7_9BACL|nr:sporulation protein [Thermoflavimicrobium dichotomicum]SFJ17743.1 Sporulation-control protein spo0M [Thermoflavimicrobium dichotomicum]
MFKNIHSNMGYGDGDIRVDLRLSKNQYALGETLCGEIEVIAGSVKQYINQIYVRCYVSFVIDNHEQTQLVYSYPIRIQSGLDVNERKCYAFTFGIREDLLVSSHTTTYYFETKSNKRSESLSNREYFEIVPPSYLQQLIDSFQQLGFQEKYGSRRFNGHYQEFVFAPASFLRGKVEEVKFVAELSREGILLNLKLDAYWFWREHELKRQVWFSHELLDRPSELEDFVEFVLQDMLRNPHFPHIDFHPEYHHYFSFVYSMSDLSRAIGSFVARVF